MTPAVFVETESVERLLLSAQLALSSASMMGFLSGPMTEHVQRRAQERFMDQGTDAGPWEPLRESTIRIREMFGFPPGPINVRTGAMERFVTGSGSRVAATGGGAMMVHPGNEPEGTEWWALFTAQGGKADVPAREVVGLEPHDLQAGLAALNVWLVESISMSAGGR